MIVYFKYCCGDFQGATTPANTQPATIEPTRATEPPPSYTQYPSANQVSYHSIVCHIVYKGHSEKENTKIGKCLRDMLN